MGVRMAEGFYVTYDAWILPKRWAWFVNLCTRVRCDLPPEMYVKCDLWNVFHCEKTSKFPSHLVHKKIDLKFSFHTYEVQIFRTPTLFCYTLEWHLKVLVFVSFFKDIDTKQLEGKCTFDAMYEKLLNMQFGKHSFQNLLFNCCLWLKRIWHPKFF